MPTGRPPALPSRPPARVTVAVGDGPDSCRKTSYVSARTHTCKRSRPKVGGEGLPARTQDLNQRFTRAAGPSRVATNAPATRARSASQPGMLGRAGEPRAPQGSCPLRSLNWELPAPAAERSRSLLSPLRSSASQSLRHAACAPLGAVGAGAPDYRRVSGRAATDLCDCDQRAVLWRRFPRTEASPPSSILELRDTHRPHPPGGGWAGCCSLCSAAWC